MVGIGSLVRLRRTSRLDFLGALVSVRFHLGLG